MIIIIPGTWATKATWYKPGGDFFEAVKSAAGSDPVIAFNWSCKVNHEDRVVAASQLVAVLNSYPQNIEFTIIGHSHGGNVGILASQQIGRQCIRAFYALSVPVDNKTCYPNMQAIKKFFNLFSWQDLIQIMSGYKRVYKERQRVLNISVKVNKKSPFHTDMHCSLIGHYLFQIEGLLEQNLPWLVNFHSRGIDFGPEFDREHLLEVDESVLATVPGSLRDKGFSKTNS